MDELPRWKFWRLHRATVIALLLVASGVVWANGIEHLLSFPGSRYHYVSRFGWPCCHSVIGSGILVISYSTIAEDIFLCVGMFVTTVLIFECVLFGGRPKIHLSTVVVMMIVVGALIGANTNWGMPYGDSFRNTPANARINDLEFGWPVCAYSYSHLFYDSLLTDAVVNFVLLFLATFLAELRVRRRISAVSGRNSGK